MATCPNPNCNVEVTLAAVKNPRNGKWTVLPLEEHFGFHEKADFTLIDETHEAVNIMGEVVGEFPVALYQGEMSRLNTYRTHSPSHFLEGGH